VPGPVDQDGVGWGVNKPDRRTRLKSWTDGERAALTLDRPMPDVGVKAERDSLRPLLVVFPTCREDEDALPSG